MIPGSGRSPGEGIGYLLLHSWASLVAQLVKNLPAKQETWVQSLGWEDPLVRCSHTGTLAASRRVLEKKTSDSVSDQLLSESC